MSSISKNIIMLWRVFTSGVVNFIRNFSISIAATAVMIVTLTIILMSVVVNATFNNTVNQITNKIVISVYLKDSDSQTQISQLVNNLRHLSNVKSVAYLDKAQVLRQYEQENSGNQQLELAISETSNPLPATIHIKPVDINKIGGIKTYLDKTDVAALQSNKPSYSGNLEQAINNIAHATDVLKKLGVIAVIVFCIISVLIILNTIQMAIFNRRDEIQIMRLLGASKFYVRAPFVVESAIYGLLAGVISIIIINTIFLTASSTFQATSLGLLDIGYATNYFGQHFWEFLGLQIIAGMAIGGISAILATRRYLKFKVN